MLDRGRFPEWVGRLLTVARHQQVTLLSAAVAFYAFLSLVPLGLLATGIAASIGGEALADYVVAAAGDVLTPSAQELLVETILDEPSRQTATVAGALGLIWGASRVLRGLDRAFAVIYGTVATKSLLDSFWDALIVAAAVTAGLGLVGLFELVLVLAPVQGTAVIAPLLVVPALVAAFLPMYVIFPDVEVTIREALPGTLVAALGWLALSRTFAIYTAVAGSYAFYGALGAVFLVLIWLYVGSFLVVFGAVLNAVLADRELDRQLQSPGPRHLGQRAMTDDDRGVDEPSSDDEPGAAARDSSSDADGSSDPGRTLAGAAGSRDRTRDRADDPAALREEIERLRDELEAVEDDVASRTVRKESLKRELEAYVRARVRRGHAHGWGPYLVLGYGTAMAIAAFYFLDGGWAILAMLVVWTSTLGVYVLMLLVGASVSVLGLPGRLRDRIGRFRS